MSNNGTYIKAPVSINDLQQVLGTSEKSLAKIILTPTYGGANNGKYMQAFWTREYNKQGVDAEGELIKNTEPLFNVFSQRSPTEWVSLGGELTPRLKKSSIVPAYVNGERITYSYNLNDFDGYDHSSVKAELDMPANLTSNSTEIRKDIVYYFPDWLAGKMPDAGRGACWVLTYVEPDAPGYNFDFAAVQVGVSTGGGDSFLFKAVFKGMPEYKDQTLDLHLYVSVWEFIGTGSPVFNLNYKDYRFVYKSPNIGKAYHTVTTITGTKDRPAEIINMDITFNPTYLGTYNYAYYERVGSHRVIVNIIDLDLTGIASLFIKDTQQRVHVIEAGYYSHYQEEIALPPTNYRDFILWDR